MIHSYMNDVILSACYFQLTETGTMLKEVASCSSHLLTNKTLLRETLKIEQILLIQPPTNSRL